MRWRLAAAAAGILTLAVVAAVLLTRATELRER